MNEHRRQILEMLAAGKITADEAEGLIAALEKDQPTASSAQGGASEAKSKAKYLRIVVDADEGRPGRGPTKVNARIPMQLLRAGVKLASLIPAQARDHVNVAMREHGIGIDLGQIKPENLEELVEQLQDLTVDVDEKDNKVKVRIFSE